MSDWGVSTARLTEVVESAKKWLLESGIQNISPNLNTISGGFNSWYDRRGNILLFRRVKVKKDRPIKKDLKMQLTILYG